jgi:predicted transposase YdaD
MTTEKFTLVLEEFENTRLYQQVMDRGEQKGRSNEALTIVQRQLPYRCGDLSPSLLARVQALPLEKLEALSEALLDFRDGTDLERWLAQLD